MIHTFPESITKEQTIQNTSQRVRIWVGNIQDRVGIKRLKQHLIGGRRDIHKCPKTNLEIAKELKGMEYEERRNLA